MQLAGSIYVANRVKALATFATLESALQRITRLEGVVKLLPTPGAGIDLAYNVET